MMLLVDQSSFSLLLRATHVLAVQVVSFLPGGWSRKPEGGVIRQVEAEIRIEEIAKGTVGEPVGAVVKTTLAQHGTGISRIAAVPGVWSPYEDIEPGARFVTMSVSGSESAAELLRDPACQAVIPSEDALSDVHLAEQVEDGALDIFGAVALAKQHAPTLKGLYVDYVWARFSPIALADEEKFVPVAELLEQPGLATMARSTLISRLTTGLTNPEPPPEKQLARYAISLFRLLEMPEAEGFHDHIVGTYLPTVLDVTSPEAPSADRVFEDHPGEKARAQRALSGYKGEEPTAPLLAWLSR